MADRPQTDEFDRGRTSQTTLGREVHLMTTVNSQRAPGIIRRILKDAPLLSPGKIGTDGANTFPSTIKAAVDERNLHSNPVHYVTKYLQQCIESGHFGVNKNMPKIDGFQSLTPRGGRSQAPKPCSG